ncbi:hypothetical protein [Streptococcus suis]|uniref:Uncharacterized protein n=1 Tax=Streptococcus suis TaxID=1307 RepID=A0A9X4MPQ3_STRSU|nr:hypothetical protein [Streptococcus suis]MDG4516433.1 hypothetical protein [Streptococcus suis]MDG4520591.1 hypothetical protein [Streptococcus suis]MDG4522594.1 hypothetical protein [Streptococcus suis]
MTNNLSKNNKEKNIETYEIIAANFKDNAMTVGIDKITLIFEAEVFVDKKILNVYRKKYPKNIMINSTYFIQGKVNNITIKEFEIGKIIIAGNNINTSGTCQCNFELINGSINIKTSNIEEIKERLFNSLKIIELKTGISIKLYSNNEVIINSIELAFTFSSKNRINLFTRLLFHRCLSSHQQPDKQTYPILDSTLDHHILSSKEGYNLTFVTYDKTAKCEKDGYLEENVDHGFRLYRFEITLKKSNVKKFLGTNELFELSAEHIQSYLKSIIKNGYENLIKSIKKSVRDTDKLIEKVYFESNPNDYIEQFFLELLRKPLENVTSVLLDEEIILYLELNYLKGRGNRSRTIDNILTKIMQRSKYDEYPLSIMATWQTLILLKFMEQILDENNSQKYIPQKSSNDNSFQAIYLRQYPIEKRKVFYDNFRRKRTKKSSIDQIYKQRWLALNTKRIENTIEPKYKD